MEVHLFLQEDSPFHLLLLLMRTAGLGWVFFSLLKCRVKSRFFLYYLLYEFVLVLFGHNHSPFFYFLLFAEPFWLSWLLYINTYESFRFSYYTVAILFLGFELFRGFFLFGLYSIVGHLFFLDFHVLVYGLVTLFSIHILSILFQYFHRYLMFIDDSRFMRPVRTSFLLFLLIHICVTVSYTCTCSILSIGCSGFFRSLSIYVFILAFFRIRKSILSFEKEGGVNVAPIANFCQKLGFLYQELRGFRHDFAGLLVSFNCAIESRDWNQVEKLYREVLREANGVICSSEYSYFDLSFIEDKTIRSLILHFLCQGQELGLDFRLEIQEKIPEITVNQLALVRMLTILLTNAIEAAELSKEKRVVLALSYHEQVLDLVLENSRPSESILVQEIFQPDWSTKGQGRGTGLYTVQRILNHEEDFLLETDIGEANFTQHLTIRSQEI